MWESHAEDTDSWGAYPNPDRPVYRIDDVRTESEPEVSSEDQDILGLSMRHLLPMQAVSPPRVTPIPSDREQLIQRLMGTGQPVRPVLWERSSLTDMDTLLQSLLPVGSLERENLIPAVGRHESMVMYFSCGKSGNEASRCPFLATGMASGLDRGWICYAPSAEGG